MKNNMEQAEHLTLLQVCDVQPVLYEIAGKCVITVL